MPEQFDPAEFERYKASASAPTFNPQEFAAYKSNPSNANPMIGAARSALGAATPTIPSYLSRFLPGGGVPSEMESAATGIAMKPQEMAEFIGREGPRAIGATIGSAALAPIGATIGAAAGYPVAGAKTAGSLGAGLGAGGMEALRLGVGQATGLLPVNDATTNLKNAATVGAEYGAGQAGLDALIVGGSAVENAIRGKLASGVETYLKAFPKIRPNYAKTISTNLRGVLDAPSTESLGPEFEKFFESAGLKSGAHAVEAVTGKAFLSPNEQFELMNTALAHGNRDPQLLLAARHEGQEMLNAARLNNPNYAAKRQLIESKMEQLNQQIEDLLPGYSDLRLKYHLANAKESLSSVLPLNKTTGQPDVLRSWLTGLASILGRNPSGAVAMAAISPIAAGSVLETASDVAAGAGHVADVIGSNTRGAALQKAFMRPASPPKPDVIVPPYQWTLENQMRPVQSIEYNPPIITPYRPNEIPALPAPGQATEMLQAPVSSYNTGAAVAARAQEVKELSRQLERQRQAITAFQARNPSPGTGATRNLRAMTKAAADLQGALYEKQRELAQLMEMMQ